MEPSEKALATRLAAQQRQREIALWRLRKLRVKARAEIDRLLEFLDASDLDPDLEPVAVLTAATAFFMPERPG